MAYLPTPVPSPADAVKRRLPGAFLCLALLSALAAGAAPVKGDYKPAMRGVFVDAFGTQYRDHLNASRLVADLQRYDVQYCFLQVCVLGEGFYKSEILPRAAGLPVGYDDPLADILEMSKARKDDRPGLSIHAWVSPLQTHNRRAIISPPGGHVGVEHPEWLTEDVEGNKTDANGWFYLDPGHPQARDHVVSIVLEIVDKYDVDGMFVDGLSYPENGSRFGYNETALEEFHKEMGGSGRPDPHDPKWSDWRRQQVTSLAARIAAEIKGRKPGIVLSFGALAAGSPPKNADGFLYSEPYVERMQDWPDWIDEKIPDWVCLMNFCDEPTQSALFDGWTAFAAEAKDDSALWIGVAGYRNWAIDAFSQVRRVRMTPADGVAIYNFRQPVRDLAVTEDFFAAVRGVTLLSSYDKPAFARDDLLPKALQERLERMRKVASARNAEPVPVGLAPGIGDLPPGSAPSTGLAPVSIPETTPDQVPLEPGLGSSAPAGKPVEIPGETASLPFFDPWDTIYLTNRSIFQGRKLGEVNGECIFETASGMIIKIGAQHVERIQRGAGE